VIFLLVWFYLTGFAILMGGEVNSEIARAVEARTVRAAGAAPGRAKPARRRRRPRRAARR
jgi:uncharacterized BrkB/YihY/UPF0761 family membrane protein